VTVVDVDDAPATDAPRRRRAVVAKIALGIAITLLVAMWIYAFGFASKKAAYRVDDASWRARGEEICAKWERERLKLVDMEQGYIAEPTPAQMLQRATIVEHATDILQAELDEVTAVIPASTRDRDLVAKYRGFVETLIADRREYTAQLRRYELEPYRESVVANGPVSNVIIDFTTVNEMRSCAPPGELGGDT
jgi:hypothetical protein